MKFPIKTFVLMASLMSPAWAQYRATHTFTLDDVLGGFDGKTFADDSTIACGCTGCARDCGDGDAKPINDKDSTTLYPLDSEFGFNVVDFLGAAQLVRDPNNPVYQEGFAGTIFDGSTPVGLKISNSQTKTYKVPPPLGTWCQGLSATSVKCSTEHYSVMEHILSCHETIPYLFADADSGDQEVQTLVNPDGSTETFSCAAAELDNEVQVLSGGDENGVFTCNPNPPDDITTQCTPAMEPNDNTDVLNDIAFNRDYSITLKDDGKVLYRWGSLIKRPTDVRLYAKIPLPDEWKEVGAPVFQVSSAYLKIDHLITNNPNDQVRAEDLENEGATGRTPSYVIDSNGRWLSLKDCFEGDGDLIPGELGEIDPQEIPAGTVFKQDMDLQGDNPPQLLSADLIDKFTNAYYTTIDRDPFEWSYRETDNPNNVFEFVGSSIPLADAENQNLELVSGPRWRLKANKFGQDIPGLEIPRDECSPPPYQSDNKKYEVGERVETWINLLDFEGPSPLATSSGWVHVEENEYVEVQDGVEVTIDGELYPVSINGLPMTEDFDLAIYIKGDRKPTAIYSAELIIDYEGGPGPTGFNLKIEILSISPVEPALGDDITITVQITNDGPLPIEDKKYLIRYSDDKDYSFADTASFSTGKLDIGDLDADESVVKTWTINPYPDTTPDGDCFYPFTCACCTQGEKCVNPANGLCYNQESVCAGGGMVSCEDSFGGNVNARIAALVYPGDDTNPDDDKDIETFQIKRN